MTGPEAVLAVGVGLAVGLVVGLLGAGGSVLTVPALMLLLGISASSATATSLVVVVVVASAGTLGHARGSRVHWRSGGLFALAGVPAAALAGRVSILVSDLVLTVLLISILAITAVWMWRREPPRERAEPAALPRIAAIGAAIGAMTGLLGVGGGFVVVPALIGLLGLSMPMAIGTSQFVLVLNAIAGLAGRIGADVVNLPVGLAFAFSGAVGSTLASRFVGRLSDRALMRLFSALLAAICVALTVQLALGGP